MRVWALNPLVVRREVSTVVLLMAWSVYAAQTVRMKPRRHHESQSNCPK